MPSFTKKAIVESFMRLAGKKPIDKITVRDVVDDCGINRNTFYYYFQDIYAVLEEVCHGIIEKLPQEAPLSVTLSTFFRMVGDFAADHPRTAKSLVVSLGHDGLERYFVADMDRLILAALRREAKDPPPSADYLQHLTVFLRHAVFGLCVDLLRGVRTDETEKILEDLAQILRLISATL